MIGAKLIEAAGNGISTGTVAEAIDFDGTNDYLSRGDLVGNTDGKTFTFSAWVWKNGSSTTQALYSITAVKFGVFLVDGSTASIYGINTSGVQNLVATFAVPTGNTFMHILCSLDLSNSASRAIYINDVAVSVTWSTYNNSNIDFTQANHWVASYGTTYKTQSRLSNVFLDYTYRDLSVEANRRLFITADLKPAADQAALNPILYLPMNDPTAPGVNAGTGGNFTLTGTVARSGRGPNQYNAPYSDLDGTADYLSRTTALTGIADGKQLTVAFNINADSFATTDRKVMEFASTTAAKFYVNFSTTGLLELRGFNAAGTTIFRATTGVAFVIGRNYHVVASVDLSNSSNRFIYVNGVLDTTTWTTYTNENINFNITSVPRYRIAASSSATQFVDGRLGALWFNTSYIDLSVADNLAKFVTGTGIDAKPVDLGANGELPTGTSPLIYLPMYGNNAGKNYGTGGDFTVNSGPYTGARGPNEFWGNILAPANGGGSYSSNYLKRASSLVGVTSNKTLSASFFFRASAVGSVFVLFDSGHSSGASGFRISVNASNQIVLAFTNSSSIPILSATTTSASIAANTWYHVCFSVDMSNSANRSVYVNGTSITTTWSTYSNNDLPLADVINLMIDGLSSTLGNTNQTLMSEFYLNNSYIDFTQEANRLKFRDAFGNPVDLTQQIEDAAIPNPAIYMRFPPTAFGTNYGTGGDFTVNGTITDGGQL